MADPKAALQRSSTGDPDTSTLGTQLSSLSISDDSVNSSRPDPSAYQAFILAGFGHNLYPLTEEDNLPKALLPIANIPLIFYPLQWCSSAGFQNVTILCHTESLVQISAYIASLSLSVSVNVEAPSSVEDNLGSADVLGLLNEKITNDFIVLSCDSFTTLPAADLLSFHVSQGSSATAVFFDALQNPELVNLKLQENDNNVYVGYEKQSHRLLLVKQAMNVEESLDVRTSLLWRYPRMSLATTLQDAHIYIFKRWVLDLISKNEKISSLRTDLLPVLAKMQWQSNLRNREGVDSIIPSNGEQSQHEHDRLLPPNLKIDAPLSVSLYVTSPSQYTLRANSISTYLLLNQRQALLAPDPKKHPSSKAGAKTSVGQDSLVAENCSLGERVQIRKSVLSTKVNVGSRTVIRGSVIMEGAEIGENVKLEGCVVCKGAKLGDKVSLTECYVGAGYQVEEGTKATRQNLVELDDLEDGEEEDLDE